MSRFGIQTNFNFLKFSLQIGIDVKLEKIEKDIKTLVVKRFQRLSTTTFGKQI